VVLVAVIDETRSTDVKALQRRLEDIVGRSGAELVPRDRYVDAAARKGIKRRDLLKPFTLEVVLEVLDADFVLVGRIARAGVSTELTLVALNRSSTAVARARAPVSVDIRTGSLSVSEPALQKLVEALMESLPRVERAVEGPVVGDPIGSPATVDRGPPPTPDARDADIFGPRRTGPLVPDASTEAAEIAGPAPSALSTTSLVTDKPEAEGDDMELNIAAADAAFAFGGRLFLRLNSFTTLSDDLPRFSWDSPSILYLYADARPHKHVRAFAQGRLDANFTRAVGGVDLFGRAAEPLVLSLDELWLGFDLGDIVFFKLGRQKLRWGSGYIWNPTDFLNIQRRDSIDFFDQRIGVDLLKVHIPIQGLGMNHYLIAQVQDASNPLDAGVAARSEVAFWTAEVALSAAYSGRQGFNAGADASIGLWIFDFRFEGAVSWASPLASWRGTFEPGAEQPTAVSQREQLIPQLLAGVDATIPYADKRTFVVGVEYFYNGAGYDDATLYPWLLLTNTYQPLFTGRHYAAGFFSVVAPFGWEEASFRFNTIGNLSDTSFISRLDGTFRLYSTMDLNLFVAGHYGRPGELTFATEVPPLADFPAFPQGISIARPLVDLGAAFVLEF
jgi:hypothetical protein